MNYEPNSEQWPRGAIVIHDYDAKEPKMLMKIIGYTRGGLAKCQYVDRRKKREIYPNEFGYLHSPEQFGMRREWGNFSQENLERTQANWERVRRWNYHYKTGQRVMTISADGGFEDVTTGAAHMLGDCDYVHLKRGGLWSLKFVKAICDVAE